MENTKKFNGKIVSNKMKDTVIVEVSRYVKHPKYKKFIKKVKRIPAHTKGEHEIGQKITIASTRPISKTKRFTVIE